MKLLSIPVGFRCYTTKWTHQHRDNKLAYPFHYGFFPVESVDLILQHDRPIQLTRLNTCPVIKRGECSPHLRFITSTYEHINHQWDTHPGNSLLDSTGGYYVLSLDWNCVFAHYVWHHSSTHHTGQTIDQSLVDLSATLTRRRDRLLEHINDSDELELVWWSHNGSNVAGSNLTNQMTIDTHTFDLSHDRASRELHRIFSPLHRNIRVTLVSDTSI